MVMADGEEVEDPELVLFRTERSRNDVEELSPSRSEVRGAEAVVRL